MNSRIIMFFSVSQKLSMNKYPLILIEAPHFLAIFRQSVKLYWYRKYVQFDKYNESASGRIPKFRQY
ncbi:uncharacterized protein METZ01_LOCUS421557 [marine metagenome]|uniref:Uncharacterized protein n=1 Tax=marine metagenome TaxID=408172 RepID=A0A382XCI9_9ZZZZ